MNELTQEDYQNILKLIARVKDITGGEALAVAALQQKLAAFIIPATKIEEPPKENE